MDGTESLYAGSVLAGRYVINQRIFKGQNSCIYISSDLRLPGKAWTIKQWLSDRLTTGVYGNWGEQRISTLVKILSTVSHPNLIPVVDYFEENGFKYVIMELVDGCSLFDLIYRYPQGQFLPEARVIAWMIQVCQALHYLHTLPHSVLVLDIKPDNIMLASNGKIKLIDFGLARFFNPAKLEPVEYGLGTPGYSPPEQVKGKQVDVRADIYGVGATMFHLLTKRKPEEFQTPLPSVKSLNPTVSDHITNVVGKATNPEPAGRYSSVSDLLDDLMLFSAGDPVEAEEHFVKGLSYLGKGNTSEALNELQQAVLLAPNAQHIQTLGHALFDGGNPIQAEQVYELALQLGGNDPKINKNLGTHFLRTMRYESAVVFLERAFAEIPNDASLCHELGVAYYSLGRFFKAAELFERAISLGYKDPNTYDGLGDAYWGLGDWLAALELDTHAQILSPMPRYSQKAQRDLQMVVSSEKYHQTVIMYKETINAETTDLLIRACQEYAELLLREGKVYKGSKNIPGFQVIAQSMFERGVAVLEMIRINVPNRTPWIILADVYKELGELTGKSAWLEKGIRILEESIQIGNTDIQQNELLQNLYLAIGRSDAALALRLNSLIGNENKLKKVVGTKARRLPSTSTDDLMRVKGIGATFSTRLHDNGITTISRLAVMDPDQLANILKISEAKAMAIVNEARSLI